jgi:type I restriction enzyme S subunit
VRVGDLVGLDNGFAFKPSHWKKAGLPIIRIQNLNNPDAAFNYCRRRGSREMPRGTGPGAPFAWSGTPAAPRSAATALARREGRAESTHLQCGRFDDKATDRRFLRLAINQNLDEYI